jgi:hypothetical protein
VGKISPEKAKEYRDRFNAKNPNYEKEYSRTLREKRPSFNKEACARYREKEGFNESRREYNKKYLQQARISDKQVALRDNLRSRIRTALKAQNQVKSTKTLELIGCSIEELRKHLENLFTEGMMWQNYGMWHIDHKKPCSLFDLTQESEQKACFHYTNLQPLWAIDNLKKSNKY